MTRIAMPFAILTSTLALALPAEATNLTRTFVSSAGSDSNPCTITQPCATFAHAYGVTAASGIVAALDPGKYGPLTITGPITINGNGWAAITAPAAGNGITITAGTSDKVILTGLEIDGAGAAYDGIVLHSAGSLTAANCVLQNFIENGSDATTGNGIVMLTTSNTAFTITDTTASNNGGTGIAFLPSSGSMVVAGIIDHVIADANRNGISINTTAAGNGFVGITVSNTIASNNLADGITVDTGPTGTPITLSIDNANLSSNVSTGVLARNTSTVLLSRSVITVNGIGVQNSTSPNTFYTYQNNQIDLNGGDILGTALNTKFMR